METMERSIDSTSDVRLQALKSLHMILQEKDQTAHVYKEKAQRYEKALQQAESRYGNQNINDNNSLCVRCIWSDVSTEIK